MAVDTKNMTEGKILPILIKFALPLVIGPQGIFFAEVSAWFGANLILVPAFIYLMKKLK